MNIFVGELVGTAVLILLGEGVVANVVLNRSKGQDSGWIVITAGWGFAVAMAIYIAGWTSGAHINPAVTIALALVGDIPADQVFTYLAGQFVGAAIGAFLVWVTYFAHWAVTDNPDGKLGIFATIPAIRHTPANLMTEIIGTAVLMVGVLGISNVNNGLANGMSPFLVGILVFSIGLSLGGPTGYAINPARDLAPRIVHAILPIPGKRDSDWGYAWIPVVGPIIGGLIGAMLYTHLFANLTPLK